MADKWEYCEMELKYGGGVYGEGWFYREDGNHEHFDAPKYGAVFAKLGLEGWELVTSSTHAAFGQGKENTVSYLFRRALKE